MDREIGIVWQTGLSAGAEPPADGVIITDATGRIQYTNPGYTELTGFTGEEAAGRLTSFWERQPAAFHEELKSTVGTGRVWRGERINVRKDGISYREEVQISPLRDQNNEITGYIGILRDVTSRHAADEAQSFLASIVEHSEAAIFACSPAGMILTWNRGAQTIFGYSPEEAIGKPLSMLLVPERLASLPHLSERIMQGHEIPLYESVVLHQEGRRIHVSITGSPIRNSAGAVTAISLIIGDISETRRTEAALHDSEERFRIMADGCPSPMWVTNAEGGNQFVNRAYLEFTGTPYERVQGDKWQLVLHPDDASRYIESFHNAVRNRAPFHAEVRAQRHDGDWRLLESHAEPRVSATGEFLGHVGISPDITDRKRTEDALRYQYSLIRAIHEVSPDGILVLNDRDDIVSYNSKFLKVWCIAAPDAPDNPHGDSVLSAVLERVRDRDLFMKRISDLSATPEANDYLEIELLDGRTIESYSISLARGGDPRQGRVWFFRDVTDRKEAANRLERSEEKFRQLAENINEAFWMMDAEGKEVLYVSAAYEEIWGRSCDSVYADAGSWINSIHPDDRSQAMAGFSRQLSGEILENEYRILRPSGDIRWIRDRAFPVRDRDGNLVRLAGVAEDTTERKISELRLVHQGLHDDLTDLPNRRHFRERLGRALAELKSETSAREAGRTGAVFFMDLDQFKLVNDTLGHAAGDELLKAVASRWGASSRLGCNLARFGGDEFTLFATGLDGMESVRRLGTRLIECLNEPFNIAGQEVFVGASIGISLFPDHGTEANTLMRAADAALHEAKRNGKNQLRFYASELSGAARGRLEMDTRLRKALAQSEFRLQFQPQFTAGDLQPIRFEALIRWYPPDDLPIPPLDFIPIAEQNGLIIPIGSWVLQDACRRCAAWQAGNLSGVGVAVNVSSPQIASPDFVAVVTQALESAGLAPHLLEIELTESVFLRDMDAAVRTLQKLRALGVTIALDDFGTGYSSLSYLQNLPLDALKIDRSFLAGPGGLPQGPAVLRCLVELAHAHGLRVVAEGVETVPQRDLLHSLGCDELQGFLLGIPSFQLAGINIDAGIRALLRATSIVRSPWHSLARIEAAGDFTDADFAPLRA